MATITLTPELEQAIQEQARQKGTTLELMALDTLNDYFLSSLQHEPLSDGETMADFFKDFIGSIDSREIAFERTSMSENTGRTFGKLMIKKYREGKL